MLQRHKALVVLLQRIHIARNANCCNSPRDSVCLSVCPFVTFSIVPGKMIRLCGFQCLVGQSL